MRPPLNEMSPRQAKRIIEFMRIQRAIAERLPPYPVFINLAVCLFIAVEAANYFWANRRLNDEQTRDTPAVLNFEDASQANIDHQDSRLDPTDKESP